MEKLDCVNEVSKHFGVLKKKIVRYVRKKQPEVINAIDISRIMPGMYWFEDDTFSEMRLLRKKIKAIVEVVEDGVIYGDLTVSEIENVKEQRLSYDDAKEYIKNFSHLCKENEVIVLYDHKLLTNVGRTYGLVQKKIMELGKNPRLGWQWSLTQCDEKVWVEYFGDEGSELFYGCGGTYVRPVIALKVM